MKREYGRLYIVGTILFFTTITVIFLFQLVQIRKMNEEQARSVFESIAVDAEQRWNSYDLPDAAEGLATRFLTASPRPLVIGVYSFEFGMDYLWARDDRFLTNTEYTPLIGPPAITMNEIVHQRFSRSFTMPNGERRIVTAVFPVLDGPAVYPLLKYSLVAILAFLALLVTVMLTAVTRQKSEPRDTKPSPVTDEEAAVDLPPSSGPAAPLTAAEDLARRLELELKRAAFQEQDLSVAVFRFTESTDALVHDQNVRAVVSFFGFEDLCFSLTDGTIVVVFPTTSLTDALGQIERFQRYYWNRRRDWNIPDADFFCGVSARNGRLVPADRILNESKTAAKRATDTSGRIVGFFPDPQLYREYVMNHSR